MNERTLTFRARTDCWYSQGEESPFFQWLYSLAGYPSCSGKGRTVEFVFDASEITEETACDLVAMYRRCFSDDIRQLQQLQTSSIGHWFSSPKMYWHELIF